MKKDKKQQKGRSDSSLCCEYAQALGDGNVSKAELVLESFFDLVGITEVSRELVLFAAIGAALTSP